MDKVNIAEKLALHDDYWVPRVVGELNGHLVKVVKFKGPFLWHHHDNEDEMFLVVRGVLRMELRDRTIEVDPILVDEVIHHKRKAVKGWPVKTERELHRYLVKLTRALQRRSDYLHELMNGFPSGADFFKYSRKVDKLFESLLVLGVDDAQAALDELDRRPRNVPRSVVRRRRRRGGPRR